MIIKQNVYWNFNISEIKTIHLIHSIKCEIFKTATLKSSWKAKGVKRL